MPAAVSASFEGQRTALANVIQSRVRVLRGNYLIPSNAVVSSDLDQLGVSTVFGPEYSVGDLAQGIRSGLNLADVEGTGRGRGWKSCQRSGVAGAMQGVVARNLYSPVSGVTPNNDGVNQVSLAVRFTVPTPSGPPPNATLKQIAIRVAGTVATNETIHIQGDVAGLPDGFDVATMTLTPTTPVDGWAYFDVSLAGLALGAKYWIILGSASSTAINYWSWTKNASVTGTEYAATDVGGGGAWVAAAYTFHYRTVFTWAGSTDSDWVTFTFPSRTLNRLRVYSLNDTRAITGRSVLQLRVQYFYGGVWNDAAITEATQQQYGTEPSPAAFAGGVVSQASGFTDVSTADTTCTGVRLYIEKMGSAGVFPTLLCVETFLQSDVTSYVSGFSTSGQRDQFYGASESRSLSVQALNQGRFWSPLYAPTVPQIAAGYFNSELTTDLEIIVDEAFLTPEYVPLGTYYLDRVNVQPRARSASLQARDYTKYFENQDMQDPGLFSKRVEDLIERCANRANWPSSRMNLAHTESFVGVWIPTGTTIRDEIGKLGNGNESAAPFATVRFDETNTLRLLTFVPSSQVTPQDNTWWQLPAQPAGSKVLVYGDKVYFTTHVTGSPDVQMVVEYDVPTRVSRTVLSENVFSPVQGFTNLATDGTYLYATDVEAGAAKAYRVNLSNLTVTTFAIAGSNGVSDCDQGYVDAGFYYAVVNFGGTATLIRVTLPGFSAGASLGAIQGAGVDTIGRIVRWNPGSFDRLYWSAPTGALTKTYFDLVGAVTVNDAVTRKAVTTDGTLLYEVVGATLQSRTAAGVLSTIDSAFPAAGSGSKGYAIQYSGGRIWSVGRTGTTSGVLRINNPLDLSIITNQMPENFQESAIAGNTEGLVAFVGQAQEPGSPSDIGAIVLRTMQAPIAPTTATLELDYNGELLDAQYSLASENGGRPSVITGVRFIVRPAVISPNIVRLWTAVVGFLPIGPNAYFPGNNPLVIPNGTSVDLDLGGPSYSPPVQNWGRFVMPNIRNVDVGFIVPSAVGPVTFGPAVSRSAVPTPAVPQQVVWTQDAANVGQLTAVLTPGGDVPMLTLSASGGDVVLDDLGIDGTPYSFGSQTVVQVIGSAVLVDGQLQQDLHGENIKSVANDYISDVGALAIAAKEFLRMFGHPQHQFSGVKVRPSPQVWQEDIAHVVEPESGADIRLIITGVEQVRTAGGGGFSAETLLTLLALPITSTAGLGQSATPAPTANGIVSP